MDSKTVRAAIATLRRVCKPEQGEPGVVSGDDPRIQDYVLGKRTEDQQAIEDFANCLAPETLTAVATVVRVGIRSKATNDEWGLFESLKREKCGETETFLQDTYRKGILSWLKNFEDQFGSDYEFVDTPEFAAIFKA